MISITTAVCLICIFSAAAMFFSIGAIALRIFSHGKLQQALKAANKEHLADSFTENTEKMALASSFYRFILNIAVLLLLLALFAAPNAALQPIRYVYAFLITTVIFAVFSLAIPHACAKYAGEKILSRTYKPLIFFTNLIWPLLRVFQSLDGVVRRLAGVTETTPDQQQEEFLTGLQQQKMEGVVDEEEQEMIENVLELSDTDASEIMTPRTDIIALEVDSDLETVLKTINAAGHSRVPVYKENIDNIVGLIYAKDLLTEIGNTKDNFRLQDKLRKAYFIPETKPIRTLLHEFQSQKQHIAILLDEYGGTAGIVTLEDIIEELVGEITDEYEKTSPEPINQIDDNTIEVDARTYIDDLNDKFELDLPEDEDYDTIGGFVFSHLGYIPKTGELFDYENLKFTIIAAETRKIKYMRIQKVDQQ